MVSDTGAAIDARCRDATAGVPVRHDADLATAFTTGTGAFARRWHAGQNRYQTKYEALVKIGCRIICWRQLRNPLS
ncbi:hypothetical protein GCT13_42350 [Paraburkholderia sp. CNPSo 3157]|uniref:Uncharacterized protein n=1 Tax=Paraburkholderia franconis TaxID=2654983 RepID=A0A7X1TL88_9BURK|nr:hypothetical protein [Paraburkholderia franconis]MPW23233.1 hypothetical protein [Paraburkholderia franconis]